MESVNVSEPPPEMLTVAVPISSKTPGLGFVMVDVSLVKTRVTVCAVKLVPSRTPLAFAIVSV
jgi:hypothetical protein